MKKIFITFITAFVWSGCFAQFAKSLENTTGDKTSSVGDGEELEFISMTDPEFEWMQYDEKNSKAILKKDCIELESKKNDVNAVTYCEFPINTEANDFVVSFNMKPDALDDDKPFGIVYDVENDNTYKAIILKKKAYQIISVNDGNISVLRKGLFKAKSKEFNITMQMKYKKLTFYVNGLPMTTIKNSVVKNPIFGFLTMNKGKLTCKSFAYKVINRVTEDEGDADNDIE